MSSDDPVFLNPIEYVYFKMFVSILKGQLIIENFISENTVQWGIKVIGVSQSKRGVKLIVIDRKLRYNIDELLRRSFFLKTHNVIYYR